MRPGMKARGGTFYPDVMRFITWKKSRSLFNLNARIAALGRSFSRIIFESCCSSCIKLSFSDFYLSSSSTVLSCQILTFESLPPVSISRLGLCESDVCSSALCYSAKSKAQMRSSCISNEFKQLCLLTFQTLTMPSTQADAIWRPALSQTAFTSEDLWPWRVATHSKVVRFQIFMLQSPDALTIICSPGLN